MDVCNGCNKCAMTWTLSYVVMAVLLLVGQIVADPANFRLQSNLHEKQQSQRLNDDRDVIGATGESASDAVSQTPTTEPPCDLCESLKLNRQQLDYVHIELTKQRILNKLRLSSKPNVTGSRPPVPHAMLKQAYGTNEETQGHEEYYAQTSKRAILAENVDVCEDDRKAVCFQLRLQKPMSEEEIKSLKFHVYRTNNGAIPHTDDTLELFEHHPDARDTFLTKVDVKGGSQTRNWLPFKINKRLIDFTTSSNANDNNNNANSTTGAIIKHLKLKCNTCHNMDAFTRAVEHAHRPYLEVHVEEPRAMHTRSTVECTDRHDECCLVRLYVSFANLEWDDWIVRPDGFQANYCAGSCKNSLHNAGYAHSRVIQGLSPDAQWEASNHYHPCCSPTKLSSQSLLIYDKALDTYTSVNLPNMVAEACGCV